MRPKGAVAFVGFALAKQEGDRSERGVLDSPTPSPSLVGQVTNRRRAWGHAQIIPIQIGINCHLGTLFALKVLLEDLFILMCRAFEIKSTFARY